VHINSLCNTAHDVRTLMVLIDFEVNIVGYLSVKVLKAFMRTHTFLNIIIEAVLTFMPFF
jgi:hypothetical protein